MRPKSRRSDLEEQWVDDELVVYDLRTHRAHCLHPLTARVRELADGTRTADEIFQLTRAGAHRDADLSAIWRALDALGDAELLESRVAPPAGEQRLSRRDLVRSATAAAAVVAIPAAISSILAPTPADAQSGTVGEGESDTKEGEEAAKEFDRKQLDIKDQIEQEQDEKEGLQKTVEAEAASKEQISKDIGGIGGIP